MKSYYVTAKKINSAKLRKIFQYIANIMLKMQFEVNFIEIS